MDEQDLKELVAAARIARLATVDPSGRPHLVPVCFALADEVIYSAVDQKPKATTRLRRLENIRSNPAVELLVDHYEEDWTRLWWVRAPGHGAVVEEGPERERGLAALLEKYAQYRDRQPNGRVSVTTVAGWAAWPASGW